MPRKRRQVRSAVTRKWQQVRHGLVCREGGHQIERSAWAMFSYINGILQSVLCEQHAFSFGGFKPPNSSFSFHGEAGFDARARRAGDE